MTARNSARDILSEGAEAAVPSSARCQLRREGEYWTFLFYGAVVRLADSRGMRHLAVLLSRPGEAIPATELNEDGRAGARRVSASNEDPEKARVNVTRALRGVIDKLALQAPGLAEYLLRTLRTGTRCSFLPGGRIPGDWFVDSGESRNG